MGKPLYFLGALILFAAPWAWGVPGALPPEEGDADPGWAPERIRIAQETPEEPPEDEGQPGIFEHLQIDLLDLKRMGEDVERQLTGESIRLSLNECVRRALETNQDILVVAYEPLKAEADVLGAKGDFDPVAGGDFGFTHSQSAASAQTFVFSGINSIVNNSLTGRFGISGLLPIGTQYDISMDIDRQRGTFTGFFSEFSGGASVTLTQPFMKGFGLNTNLVRLRTAKNALDSSESQVRLTVLNSIGEVIKAYWDLVGAIQTLQVREESLANAERLLEINERRVEIGTAAAIEVIQAKAGVATRQSDLISARTAIADAEDVLKQLLSFRDGDLFSTSRIVPLDHPGIVEFEWNEEESMRVALARRPEVETAELDLENARFEEWRSRNDLLPQLDFTTTWRQGGRSFAIRSTIEGLRRRQDKSYSFGVTASVPLGNRAARGSFDRARLNVRQAQQRVEQAKQDVMLSVRVSARSVLTNEVLVESNRQARVFQEANVAAEEQRLRLGVSTSHTVLQIQEDLTMAQTQEVQSIINFQKALADLEVAEGTLLESLGIEFELPEPDFFSIYDTVNPVQMWRTYHGDRLGN